MEHGRAMFNVPGDPQYDLDIMAAENDFDLEFDEAVDLDNGAGTLTPADLHLHPGPQRTRVTPPSIHLPRLQTQKGPQHPHRRVVPISNIGSTTQPSSSKALPKARHVINQFGQAAHRLRAMHERIAAVEKLCTQVTELSRRLSMVEQRLSEMQIGLKTAEEGHEEISEMVKASLSFLNDLNAGQGTGEQTIPL